MTTGSRDAPFLKQGDPLACSAVIIKAGRNVSECWLGGAGLGLLLAALVPACGGSVNGAPGGDGDGEPVPIEALPEQLANAYCENIAGCCDTAAIAFDLATCRANVKAVVQKSVNEALRANSRYEASAAGACVVAYGKYFKRCVEADSESIEASCNRVFVGTIALGGACTRNEECAPTADGSGHCLSESDNPQGFCFGPNAPSSTPRGKLGDACIGSCQGGKADCAVAVPTSSVTTACFADEGLQCDFRTQTCQPLVAPGGACDHGACVAGAFCTNASVCAATKSDGESCADASECTAHQCFLAEAAAAIGTCGARSLATPQACSGNLND